MHSAVWTLCRASFLKVYSKLVGIKLSAHLAEGGARHFIKVDKLAVAVRHPCREISLSAVVNLA